MLKRKIQRYDSPNYKPKGAYLKAMKRYGIIKGDNFENFKPLNVTKNTGIKSPAPNHINACKIYEKN